MASPAPHQLLQDETYLPAELAFAEMVTETERLGLYDTDPDDVKIALKAARKKSEG